MHSINTDLWIVQNAYRMHISLYDAQLLFSAATATVYAYTCSTTYDMFDELMVGCMQAFMDCGAAADKKQDDYDRCIPLVRVLYWP